jgi:hypothetical protein
VILRVSQVDYKKRGNFLNISILNATTGTNATSGDASGTNASDTSNVESSENIPASATEKAQEKFQNKRRIRFQRVPQTRQRTKLLKNPTLAARQIPVAVRQTATTKIT